MSTRLSLTGLSPSLAGFPKTVLLNSLNQFRGPNSTCTHGLGSSVFARYSQNHMLFSLPPGYLDVSVHRGSLLKLCITSGYLRFAQVGFPHSISGSKDICSSLCAFASLSRLSSALSAKASTIRSYQHNQLDLIPREWDNVHTCIALHALVIVNFF